MTKYTLSEIEKVVKVSGFVLRNSTGSHHIYQDKTTGFSLTLPKHNEGVSAGVGNKIIEMCVLIALIKEINIGSDKFKLSNNVQKIILNHHAKCKKDPNFLFEENQKSALKIENKDDIVKFIKTHREKYKKNKLNETEQAS